MKKLLLLSLTIIFFVGASAQTDTTKNKTNKESEFHTIFHSNSDNTKISGFMALNMDFGSINKDFGLLLGIDGAVLINRRFFIGFYGRGLTTMPTYEYSIYDKDSSSNITATHRGMFFHGGLLLGYVFLPEKPIHFGISTRIGAGGISLVEDYAYRPYSPHNCSSNDNYPYIAPLFVLSPQIDVEMNITYWMKFRISAGYQYVSNSTLNVQRIVNGKLMEYEVLNANDYSTPTFSLGFVFGWFK